MSPTRRSVLRGGLSVLLGAVVAPTLTACGGGKARARPTPRSGPTRTFSLQGAAHTEQGLITAYAGAVRAHPELDAVLAVPLAHHREHLRVLGGPRTGGAAPLAAAAAGDAHAAVTQLIARETAAARAGTTAAVTDTDHGSLLAAIAACESTHLDLLTAALAAIAPPAPPTSTMPASP